jgi:multidrug resistance efflux pump
MWPKMLIELLPHLVRVVPMWERFLNSRQATEKANQTVLQELADGVRADLGRVTAAHAGLYRQLQDQSAQIAGLEAEIRQAREAAERAEAAAALPDPNIRVLLAWLKAGSIATLVLLLAVLVLLLRHR